MKNYQIIKKAKYQTVIAIEDNGKMLIKKEALLENKMAIEMLKNEIDILNNLKECIFVPKIVSYSIYPNANYILFNYINGQTIDQLENLDKQTKLILILKILECIEEIHKYGIVHGDLKPQNILLDANKEIKIIDFGISKRQNQTKFKGFGSIKYSSYEQINGKTLTRQSDIYSLGVIFYEWMMGELPFTGTREEIKEKKKIGIFKESENEKLNKIFRFTLNKNIEDRYKTIEEFKVDIKKLIFE